MKIGCDQVQRVVITIDGPAGAGKSTVAGTLAKALGFDFLDTGALYRCVTLACLRANVSLRDEAAVLRVAEGLVMQLDGSRVLLNGEDVSDAIRRPEVSKSIGAIADNQSVRSLLTSIQRECAADRCMVTEGRDQGTVVFPESPCKIFLVASPEERAQRRLKELAEKKIDASYEEILELQQRRDAEDSRRTVGALRPADDAVVVCTDGLSFNEVVEQLRRIVAERLGPMAAAGQQTRSTPTSSDEPTE